MTGDLVKQIGTILGILLALPGIVVLVRVSMFIGNLQSVVTTTAQTLTDFIQKVDTKLDATDARLNVTEKDIALLGAALGRRSTDRHEASND